MKILKNEACKDDCEISELLVAIEALRLLAYLCFL